MEIMKPFIGGQFIESKSEKFNTIYNPSTGEAIAQVPCCTREEVEQAIAAAKAATAALTNLEPRLHEIEATDYSAIYDE